jgi:hypothetical protein
MPYQSLLVTSLPWTLRPTKITIKILSVPRPNQTMLSWEDLLNSDHFPLNIPSDRDVTNLHVKDIIDALKFWSKPEKGKANTVDISVVLKGLKGLLTPDNKEPSKPVIRPVGASSVEPAIAPAAKSPEPEPEPELKLKEIIDQLKNVRNCHLPAREKCVNEMAAVLSNLVDLQAPKSQASIREVIHLLESLKDSAVIFNRLRKDGLSKGVGFTGSLHCEVAIASLIAWPTGSDIEAATQDIVNEFKVSCIVSALQDPSNML